MATVGKDDFTDELLKLPAPDWFPSPYKSSQLEPTYEVFNPSMVSVGGAPPKGLLTGTPAPPSECLVAARGYHGQSAKKGGTHNWKGVNTIIAARYKMNGQWGKPQYVKFENNTPLPVSAEDPRLFKINDGSVICMWNQDPPHVNTSPGYFSQDRWLYYSKLNEQTLQLEFPSKQAKLSCQTKFEKNWKKVQGRS